MSLALNAETVEHAAAVSAAVLCDLKSSVGQHRAVVAAAPAGAGKSFMITNHVNALRSDGLRVAVAAPTNEQAFNLVDRLADVSVPEGRVAHFPAAKKSLPASTLAKETVHVVDGNTWLAENLVVGTISKFADAMTRSDAADAFDILVIDEAYQADAVRYYGIAALAKTHLLVGDAGQLDPFTTLDDATWWRGRPEDPLQTAIGLVSRNHPSSTITHKLPITWRLDPRAAAVARGFYRGHNFESAVQSGVRQLELTLTANPSKSPAVGAALQHAAEHGWAHIELAGPAMLSADLTTAETIVSLTSGLFARDGRVRSEREANFRALRPGDVAVGVPHTSQRDLLRGLLDEAGLPEVTVETANKLQGLEYEVTVVWHPLAGLAEVDAFHLDPGRLCVLLTRHRHACIVVGRTGDRDLLDGIPPATPGYIDWDPNPVLDGWGAHQGVFDHLEPHHFSM